MNLKKQKYLLISLVFLLLQIGISYFSIFTGIRFSQSSIDSWFLYLGIIIVIFSITSIVKKESGAGGALIAFEIYLAFLLMMGHGG
jgi:hypothetical protein